MRIERGIDPAPNQRPRKEVAVRPGVSTPDWSVVASRTVCSALEAIFESCDWSERWADLGEAEDLVRRAILEAYPRTGRAPSIEDLAQTTGFGPSRVRELLGQLKERDMVVLDPSGSHVIGAYPFMDRATEHRLIVGETPIYAMCAIDALGTAAMLGKDIAIESACRSCRTPVSIETREKGLALAGYAPGSAVVWSGIHYADRCAAGSLCTVMAFFCSDAHLNTWRAGQAAENRGFRLSMDEALQMGKAIFIPLLADSRDKS